MDSTDTSGSDGIDGAHETGCTDWIADPVTFESVESVVEANLSAYPASNFGKANANRAADAAQKAVPKAQAMLDSRGDELSPEWRAMLQLRVDHPTASLTELANKIGWTKDEFASRLRRALSGEKRRQRNTATTQRQTQQHSNTH